MTLLEQFRRSSRCLGLLVAFAVLAIFATALLPHDDPEERSCIACKVSQQSISELADLVGLAAPLAFVSIAPVLASRPTEAPDIESGPSRAPPA